ncbi:MAG: hypothetical protein QHJ73_13860 [Armatimonadota bacterium]|nr:hypothetical protein [Armatimonadota bacterium]
MLFSPRIWRAFGFGALLALWSWRGATGKPAEISLEQLVPDPDALEAVDATPVRFFNADNLYELIDGQATAFLTMGFVRMAARDYRLKGDQPGEGPTLSVRVYDMGTPLRAFGAFTQLLAPDSRPANVGAGGAIGRAGLTLYQDRFYLTLGPPEGRTLPLREPALLAAGKAAAAKLPGRALPPRELDLLPRRYRQPRTEGFLLADALGLSFLHDTLTAAYHLPGHTRPVKLLLSRMADPNEAQTAMSKLTALLQEPRPLRPTLGEASYEGSHAYFGRLYCFRQGRYLAALPGVEERAPALQLLRDALATLRAGSKRVP